MPSPQPHVFISHRRAQFREAERLCVDLEARGLRCWIAPRDIDSSRDWDEQIDFAIGDAAAMVVVVSPEVHASKHVVRELRLANEDELPILPALTAGFHIPPGAFRYQISGWQRIELFPDWEKGIEDIVRRLAAMPKDRQPRADRPVSPPVRVQPPPQRLRPPEMVRIPAGQFWMGARDDEEQRVQARTDFFRDARPRTRITIASDFALGKYPVTLGEFRHFALNQSTMRNGNWLSLPFGQTDWHPVVNVSWIDAQSYIAWLRQQTGKNYRLPTEAEWEYACRSGSDSARFWGDGWRGAEAFAHVGGTGTAPVDGRRPNAFGLHDMLGNVWEWTADRASDHLLHHPNDGSSPRVGSESRRVARGGSWSSQPYVVCAPNRYGEELALRELDDVGFRLALSF
jgi:formylglycine-generating enzyme required for sulfatase activity